MAKTDSFFIRQTLNLGTSGAFATANIDLGAFVDALGKSVLRIHNIAVSMTDSAAGAPNLGTAVGASGSAQFQLTTQPQTALVLPGQDKSVIASGMTYAVRQETSSGVPSIVTDAHDVMPQMWRNGYLVAVEQIYLNGTAAGGDWQEDVYCSIIMECTVETLSEKAAMALALSQS